MTRLPWSQAGLGICCLMLFIAGASGGEFRLLEPHSETRRDRIEQLLPPTHSKWGPNRRPNIECDRVELRRAFSRRPRKQCARVHMHGWTLWYTAGDELLIEASGGEDGVIRFLACIHHLMELGDNGPSHLDWRSNFAYLRSPVDRRNLGGSLDRELRRRVEHRCCLRPAPTDGLAFGSRLFSSRTVEPKTGTTSLSHVRNR